jgi:hypothetical protein
MQKTKNNNSLLRPKQSAKVLCFGVQTSDYVQLMNYVVLILFLSFSGRQRLNASIYI